MEATTENIEILKKLGFTCDYDRTHDERDKEWYSLTNGWGFRLDALDDFEELMLSLTNKIDTDI